MAKLSFIVKADRTPVTKLIQSIDELEKKVRHIQNSDLNFNKWLKAFDDLQKKVQEKKDSLERLKSQMLSLDITKMPHTKITLETNYAKVRKEYEELANEVGQASLKFDRAYKGMLDDLLLAEKNTDSVTSKMIEQKKVVSDLTSEIKRLNAEKKLSTSQTQKDSLAEQAEKTKVKLEEERATLNKLRESQEKAKLTVKGLKDEVRGYEKVTGKVAGTQAEANMVFDRLESSLVRLGGLAVLQKFSSDVIKATGDMQQLSVALSTILQSKSKADSLINEIKEFAVKTPFDLTEVGDATKQMLAYGSSSENVIKEMSMLGDVAAGLQIPIGQLIYLYGTLRTQGKAMTVDIRQFAGRGIPIYEELAKVLGTTTDKVGEFVTDGKVGFAEVEKAFQSMTSEGGKFYNMLENAAGTWPQQISQIGDSLVTKLNEFGNKHKEIFELGIGTTADLVDSLDSVINIIGGLVTTYGSYKAILIATNAVQKAGAFIENIRLIGMMRKELGLATAAQQAFNTASKANVYATLISVLLGLGMAVYMFTKRTNEATEANNSLNRVSKNASEEYAKQASTIDRLNGVLKSETASLTLKKEKLKELKGIIPGYNAELDNEGKLINNNTEAIKAYLTQLEKQIKLKAAQEELEELYRKKRLQEKDIKVKEKNAEREKKNVPDVVYGGDLGIEAQRNALSRAADAESALKQANAELKITEKNIGEIQNEIEKTSISTFDNKKLETHNKSYWETKKKEAETELSALSDIEAAGEKGLALKQKIAEYDKRISIFSSNTSKQESAAEKLRKQQESIREQQDKNAQLDKKQSLDRIRQSEDLENQVAQAEIDAMDDSFEKKEKQRELNNKKEIQALERQKEDYVNAMIQLAKDKFDAEEELKSKQNPKHVRQTFDSSSVKVDTSVFDGIIGNTSKKQLNDKIREQEDSWNEYLIKFGNYQQKRAAIIEKYDNLIKNAEDAGKAAIYEKEKQNAVDDLDNSIKNSTTLMGQLFADASQKSASEIQNVIEKAELLMQYLGAVKDEQGNALIGGKTVSKKDILGLGVSNNTLQNLELSTEQVESLRNAIDRLKGDLDGKSPFKLFETQIDAAIKKIGQGGKKNIAQGITEIGEAVASFSPAISQFGQNLGNIVGPDDLGNKIAGISDAVGGLGQTATGVGQIMSGDILGGVMSAVSGISSVVSALDGLFGADYSHYNEMKEQYDTLNSIWDELIDKKKEYIDTSYGIEANKAGKEALDLAQKSIESYRLLGRERLNAGASAGSHSIGVRIRKGMSKEGWNEAKQALGDDFNKFGIGDGRMTGLFDLSVEQLEKLKSEAPTFWAKLDGDVRGYLDNIIQGAERIEDIQEQVKEQLTQVSFDSVFDSFVDVLMDMDSSAEDFADDFEEYMQRAILTTMVGDKYKTKLQAWYDNFAKSNDDEAGITKDEMDKSQKEWDDIVSEAVSERDKLKDLFGWTGESSSTSQNSTQKGFEAMSQDTGNELNGRFTALQVAGESILAQNSEHTMSLKDLSLKAGEILTVNTEIRNIADDTRDLIAQSYLELVQISENTGNSAKYLKDIKADIAEVKNNTKVLSSK
ncbi:tape measure protein [uncultured Bacteroides sp.]|uniref:tape measure protein n=1 Tax=uncultured Bacteroides sp. TaxID=162156 RepID=UPI0025E9F584|nr:tape measure protein [uncultured Bacteroides sp.]